MEAQHGRLSSGVDTAQSSPLTPLFFHDSERESDAESCATTVPETVMAEQVANDVVKEAQSVGRPAPIDDTASATSAPAVNGESPSGTTTTYDNPSESSAAASKVNGTHASGGDAATATFEHKRSDASSRDGRQGLLNGDSGEHSGAESQAIADASGGSDTDISRPGSVDPLKQEASHSRANSTIKKPSTFKSVSVTKNFLAKSAVSTPIARAGDKAAPSAPTNASSLLTAKPRLVAKLGTGNAPRTLGKVNGAGSGPDASKVWNKNQPVPVPPPKQFTDEELKQRYGIHLATRLQADEAGKEAKWADIDDDEDDWAPDTVQWMDGTKSSGTAPEPKAQPVEEPKTILKPDPPAAPAETTAAATAGIPKPSVTGGTKTILKPGVHTQPGTKSSLVLKGQPEKPTLVAKPSNTEKKSPWAPLPPVEKVSPVQINPPAQQQQQQQPRLSQRESYGYETGSAPAKEIAPDDFNRSRRDDRGGRPELFNSQSGRYEPVNDTRRGSMRDSTYRQQPAVLHRPSHDGPAEPSAAFQTSRASADGPTWGRRRNSSNVSGSNMRRMSFDRRAPDMPNGSFNPDRRESYSVNGIDSADSSVARPAPSVQAPSPQITNAQPASPHVSVTSPVVQQQATPVAAPPREDPVEVQKRLMADKIERARQKKLQEQEAERKAEAERKERIAKKLAALGPPAEAKSKTKEASPSRASEKSASKDKVAPILSQSPPKPPVPTSDGEVAQYGMMKVHQPQTVKKTLSTEPAKAAPSAESAVGSSVIKGPNSTQARTQPAVQPTAQPVGTLPRENESSRQTAEAAKQSAQAADRATPSGPKTQAAPGPWSSNTAPAPRPWSSQLWGAPTPLDRALGNGTFDSSCDVKQPRSGPQPSLPAQNATSMAPIGTGLGQTTTSLQIAHHQPVQMPTQAGPPLRPRPIGPPVVKGPWGQGFEAQIRRDDANVVAKARQEKEQQGLDFRPEMKETYKPSGGQTQQLVHSAIAGGPALPENLVKKDDASRPIHDVSPQQSLGQGSSLHQLAGTRPSRFFPSKKTETASQTPSAYTTSKADSPPPPPETETHPVFSGSSDHPLVRLPRPSPVVRLPPSASANDTSAGSVSMPPRSLPSGGARPLAMNPEWQARFNKLLEKPGSNSLPTTSPRMAVATPAIPASRTGALAPAALSKATLDVRGALGPATVLLPNAPTQRRIFAMDRSSDIITRKGAEALFEDREFGSLPTVKVSKVPHLASNLPASIPPKEEQVKRLNKNENPFTIRRLEAFDIEKTAKDIDVVIRISNMRNPIIKLMPRRRRAGPRNSSTFKPKQGTTPNGSAAAAQKDRPRKPSQQSHTDGTSNSTRPAATHTNAWTTNNRSSPAQSQTTWARRAAAPVH